MSEDLEEEFENYLMDYENGSISSSDLIRMREMMKEHEALRKVFVRQQMLHASCYKVKLEDLNLVDLDHKQKITPFPYAVVALAALVLISVFASFLVLKPGNFNTAAIASNVSEHHKFTLIRKGEVVESSEFIENDIVKSHDKELSISYLDDDTLILLKENSEVELKVEQGAKRIYLRSGSLICDVDKQPVNKPMVIYTEHAKTTVLGTQFMLNAAQGETQLQVSEGAVNFEDKRSQKQVEAKAGYMATTTQDHDVKLEPYHYDKDIKIKAFVLIDPISETPHLADSRLVDGMTIAAEQLKSDYLNILMRSDDQYVDGVMFTFEITNLKGEALKCINEKGQKKNKSQESIFPYYVVGDGLDGREDKPCKWKWVPGEYKLTATPYGKKNKSLGQTHQIKFWIK